MKRILNGKVVSSKMNKTAVVSVSSFKTDPKYKKTVKVTKKYKAHFEGEPLTVGSNVLIEESRPISKEKRWIIKNQISNIKNQNDKSRFKIRELCEYPAGIQ